MTRFTALPVGQGDAFLLERGTRSVLIDGGRARYGFTSTLSAHSRLSEISVVVCTHADADHADGLIGLLENGSVRINEVWLPGRWTEHLADLCENPAQFICEAIKQAHETSIHDLDAYADELAVNYHPVESECRVSEGRTSDDLYSDPYPNVTRALEQHIDWPHNWWWPYWEDMHPQVVSQILDVAQRIQLVAQAAHNSGARIRWFDFDMAQLSGKASGGTPDLLIPVNSEELTVRRAESHLRELDWLALSVANRQSLVFYAPESDSEPGVLFTADSDLQFTPPLVQPPPKRNVIVTAPHHGSESNAGAYKKLANWTNTSKLQFLVRSDGNYRKRPGTTYLNYKAKRFCTLCKGQIGKSPVILDELSGNWSPVTKTCCC